MPASVTAPHSTPWHWLALPVVSDSLGRLQARRRAKNTAALQDGSAAPGKPVPWQLRRSQRRRSIGFCVNAQGLTVHAPVWLPLQAIHAALEEKSGWIARQFARLQQQQALLARIHWGHGGTLDWLGQRLQLHLAHVDDKGSAEQVPAPLASADFGARARCKCAPLHQSGCALRLAAHPKPQRQLVAGTCSALPAGSAPPAATRVICQHLPGGGCVLHLPLARTAAAAPVRASVQAWMQQQARHWFDARLRHYAPLLGVQWRKLRLSSARTRWGSASSNGTISLHWRLMQHEPCVIDYVVVHELAHLRHMNHSAQFWATVASVLPGWQAQRHALRHKRLPPWE